MTPGSPTVIIGRN